MGSLRTIFAISVVLAHAYGFVFVGGRNAVQLFYMISGFLISYVLVERHAYTSIARFYLNRYLRLYPIYAAVALLSIVLVALGNSPSFTDIYKNVPASANALLGISNLTLFFQDWVLFAGISNGNLVFSTDFRTSQPILSDGLLVPQAWTLGVELTFYISAPFLLHSRRLIYLALAFSIGVRLFIFSIGLGRFDPWTYRFFPSELALFLLGALSHQVLLPLYRSKLSGKKLQAVSRGVVAFLIAISLTYSLIPVSEFIRAAVFFPIFLLTMPLAFLFQSNSKIDSWIGDLSYPIYISHMLVIHALDAVFGAAPTEERIARSLTIVGATCLFAVFLNFAIGHPVENLRSRFRQYQSDV